MDNLPDLVTKLPVLVQYFLAILILGNVILGLIWPAVRWVMYKLWLSRREWIADCPRDNSNHLDPNIAWNKVLGARWCQMREMRKGDFFSLDIRKPRVISCIKFDVGGNREHFPQRYLLEIMHTQNSKWIDIGEYTTLDILLEKPQKLIALRLTIIEPTKDPIGYVGSPSWCIYNIYPTEVRLLGLWKAVIR